MALYDYVTSTGVIIPDAAEVRVDVENEYKAVFGSDISTDPSTIEGRLIDAEVTARLSVARNNAKLANQINPNLAEGTFLDANYALVGGKRDAAEQSTVELTLSGVIGTNIPAGSLVEDINKKLWYLVSKATINGTGNVTTTFRSVDYGAISAATGTITKIITQALGWQSVTNLQPASKGKLEQSDVSARAQRELEIGLNSRSNSHSIIAKISDLVGVNGITFRENYTNATKIIDGVTLKPHSTYVCVDGGADNEIAEAYVKSKSGGSGFNGNVSFTYTDTISKQIYNVLFDRPEYIPVSIKVTVKNASSVNIVDDIKSVIIKYANGEIGGENGFMLGEYVSPFEVAAAVNSQLQNIYISKCEVALKNNMTFITDTISMKLWQKATISENDIDVIIL